MRKRMIALFAALSAIMSLTACGRGTNATATETDYDSANVALEALQAQVTEQGEQIDKLIELFATTIASTSQVEDEIANSTTATTTAVSASQVEEQEDYKASYEASQLIIQNVEAEKASLATKVEDLENQITSGEQELQAALELIEALKAENEYEELLSESGYHVDENGLVHFRYEWAVAQTLVDLGNNTFAHKFSREADVVVLEDTRAIGVTGEYCDNLVDMARDGWSLAVYDVETEAVYTASIENLKYGKGIFLKGDGTGYELVPTEKMGAYGRQDEIAQWAIGTLPNENATFKVDFVFIADYYAPNPVIDYGCQHADGCRCGDCEDCPAVEPEKIIETEFVDREVVKEVEVIKEVPFFVDREVIKEVPVFVDREVIKEVPVDHDCEVEDDDKDDEPKDDDNKDDDNKDDDNKDDDNTPENNNRYPENTSTNPGNPGPGGTTDWDEFEDTYYGNEDSEQKNDGENITDWDEFEDTYYGNEDSEHENDGENITDWDEFEDTNYENSDSEQKNNNETTDWGDFEDSAEPENSSNNVTASSDESVVTDDWSQFFDDYYGE